MKATASPKRAAQIRQLLGDPEHEATELERFRRVAKTLSEDHPRFIDEYPQKWVAVADGTVVTADTLDELLAEVDRRAIPRERLMVRFIDRDERVLVL